MPASLADAPADDSFHFLPQVAAHRLVPLLLDGMRLAVELVVQLNRLEVELSHRLQRNYLRFHFAAPDAHYRHFPGEFHRRGFF